MADKTIAVKLRAQTAEYQTAMAAASRSTVQFRDHVLRDNRRSQAAMRQLGQGAIIAGGAILAGFGLAAKAAIDFESAFAGVRKTVEGTPEQLDAIRQGIRDMANELPAGREEIAGVAEAAGQLGIATDNVLGFSRVMIDLGNTTNLSAKDAATALARFANITQLSQQDFDRLGAVIVDLGNNFATTEAEIVDFGLRIAAAGNQIGLSEAEILGFATALSSVGLAAESGGTALSRVFLEMDKAVIAGGERLEVFALTAGMTVEAFRRGFQEDAAGAAVAFIDGLRRIQESGGNVHATLEALGFQNVRVRDTLLRATAAGDLLTDALDRGTTAWDENTALAEEAERRYETTAAKLKVLWNQLTDVAVTIGDALIPVIQQLVGALAPLVNLAAGGAEAFGSLPGPIRSAIIYLGLLAGAGLIAFGVFLRLSEMVIRTRSALIALNLTRTASALTSFAGGASSLVRAAGPLAPILAGVAFTIARIGQTAANERDKIEALAQSLASGGDSALKAEAELASMRAEIEANRAEFDSLSKHSQLSDWGLRLTRDARRLERQLGEVADRHSELNEEMTASETVSARLTRARAAYADALHGGAAEKEVTAARRELFLATVDQERIDREVASVQSDVQAALGGTEDAMGDLGEATSDTVDELEAFQQIIAGFFTLDVESALIAYEEAFVDLRDAIAENGNTLDINTEQGRANRDVMIQATEKALALAEAYVTQHDNAEAAAFVIAGHAKRLVEEATEAGLSEDAALDYAAALLEIPSERRTEIESTSDLAKIAVDLYMASLDEIPREKTTDVNVQVNGLESLRAARDEITRFGGFRVTQEPPRRHGGGPVSAGSAYIIGKAGAEELFVPRESGYVVPGAVAPMAATTPAASFTSNSQTESLKFAPVYHVVAPDTPTVTTLDAINRKQAMRLARIGGRH